MGVSEYLLDEKAVVAEDVTCAAETDRAILVKIDDVEHWIPKGHIHDDSEVFGRGHTGKLVITKWIAQKRGLWEE